MTIKNYPKQKLTEEQITILRQQAERNAADTFSEEFFQKNFGHLQQPNTEKQVKKDKSALTTP
jgi:hypothetical protein